MNNNGITPKYPIDTITSFHSQKDDQQYTQLSNETGNSGEDTIGIYESKSVLADPVETNVEATEEKAEKSWWYGIYEVYQSFVNYIWGTAPVKPAETEAVKSADTQAGPISGPAQLKHPDQFVPKIDKNLELMRASLKNLSRMEQMQQEDREYGKDAGSSKDALIKKLTIEASHAHREGIEQTEERSMDNVHLHGKWVRKLQEDMSEMWDKMIKNSSHAKYIGWMHTATSFTAITLSILSFAYLGGIWAIAGYEAGVQMLLLYSKTAASVTHGFMILGKGFIEQERNEYTAKMVGIREDKEMRNENIRAIMEQDLNACWKNTVNIWKDLRKTLSNHQRAVRESIRLIKST